MNLEHIVVTSDSEFTRIQMSRPERRNALSEAHLRELSWALRETGESAARGVIISALGPVFSAGHDFSDMVDRSLAEMREVLEVCAEMMMVIQQIPQVVLAQVEGLATAAGCQLVASADLAVCGESSQFQVPGGRGGWFCTTPGVALGRAVGRKHALEMLLTGDPIDAQTALSWGLVNRVVPDEAVAAASDDLLRRATRGSGVAKGIGKSAFYHQMDLDLPAAYRYATEVMASSSQLDDAQENMAAFVEKRKPMFTER